MKSKLFLFIFSLLIIVVLMAIVWMFWSNRNAEIPATQEQQPIEPVTAVPEEGAEPGDPCKAFKQVQSVYSCEDALILALREVEADYGGDIQKISRETIQGTDMWLVSIKLDHPHFAQAFGRVVSEVLVGVRLDGKDGPKTSYKQSPESSDATPSH